MSRSGRINHLHNLVNEATGGSTSSPNNNNSNNNSNTASDASLSSFTKSIARVAPKSGSGGRSVASRRSNKSSAAASNPHPYAATNNDDDDDDDNDDNGIGIGGGIGGGMSVGERTNTTARLMSLVQELSSSRSGAPSSSRNGSSRNGSTGRRNGSPNNMNTSADVDDMMGERDGDDDDDNMLHPEVYVKNSMSHDERSVDAESLSLASGFNSSYHPGQSQSQGHNQHGQFAVPHGLEPGGGMGGSTMGGGMSAASSQRSGPGGYPMPSYLNNATGNHTNNNSSSQYSQGYSVQSSHASGSQDPAGYVMPMGMGVLPNGSVFSQTSQSMYGNGSGVGGQHSHGSHTSHGGSTMQSSQQSSQQSSHLSSHMMREPSIIGGSMMNASHPSSIMSQSQTTMGDTATSASSYSRRSGSSGGSGHSGHSGHSGSRRSGPSIPGSSASAPGGSHGNSHRGFGEESVMSRSYMSQPLPMGGMGGMNAMGGGGMNGGGGMGSMNGGMGNPDFGGDFATGGVGGVVGPGGADFTSPMNMNGGGQVIPRNPYADDYSSFGGSKSSRSIANSAALIPRAKFSWASESLGTQSTVMTRRSVASASVPEPTEQRQSKAVEGRLWSSFAWIITFPIPNKCIMRPTKDAKQAWREKVALFVIMVSCSVFFVGVFGFVPLLLCKEDTIFSMQDIWLQTGENWVVVHGTIYDVKDLIYRHPGGVDGIVDFLGKDSSKVFPRAPPVTLPQKCLDMEKVDAFNLNVYAPDNNFTNPTCASFTELDILLGITCHTFAAGSNGTAKFLGDYERGVLSHTSPGLNAEGRTWVAIYDRVYDITTYVKGIRENQEPTVDGEEPSLANNPSAYLTPTLNKVIMNSINADATDLYEALFGSTEYIACLEELFYVGLLDDQVDTFCYILNIMMYVMLIFVATLMVIQFLASMVYICPRHRTYSEDDVMSPVMVMVPCYNEGDNELRKTIKSVLNTTYPDENKVLFMVADGVVTGNDEDMSTPEHLANILGFDIDEFEDDTFEYDCIGVIHTKNRARVYHGILQKGHKFLKYISVIKCGLPEEVTTSSKPGNRGKRDSQLITIGYYNRIHYGRELTELDSAIQRAMVDLNLQADMVRFLMAIDADTRVDTMSITHMVYGMDKKEKVLALCGETKVDNKASSWVTMIQVFEYYNSHHLKKAFEAAFGCVTCLPGCFTMYRIIADDGTPLLPGDGVLYQYSRNDIETLHEKNLYHLGEDRMLTTLLLKFYPDRSLTFIPEAACWTIVPHTFKILLSQRRRWINSTVHNMFELLRVNTMCGVCCVSMKVVVAIDLIATMILPASYCYAMYLIFLVFFEDLPVSTVLLILYGIIMGVQVVVFILRSRWDYLWWFFIYFTVGLPVFYLILPTYSFWNMDDFSWGKTRAVGGNAPTGAGPEVMEEADDDEGLKRNLKDDYADDVSKDDRSVPSREQEDDRSTTSSSSEYSGSDDESRDGSGSEYSGKDDGTDYTGSQADTSYSESRQSHRSAPAPRY